MNELNGANPRGCLRVMVHFVFWPLFLLWLFVEVVNARPSECGTLERLNQQYAGMAMNGEQLQLRSLAFSWYNQNCRGSIKPNKKTRPLKRR